VMSGRDGPRAPRRVAVLLARLTLIRPG
jgi:hypothetical protein